MRSADVLVCPSAYEPFGVPVVEAMACGVPVVASNVGGMVDTVVHDVTGLLVSSVTPRILGHAVSNVLRQGCCAAGWAWLAGHEPVHGTGGSEWPVTRKWSTTDCWRRATVGYGNLPDRFVTSAAYAVVVWLSIEPTRLDRNATRGWWFVPESSPGLCRADTT